MQKIKITLLIMILCNLGVMAEKADSCAFIQVDLANRWICRGAAYSESPVIQPSLGYTTAKVNATIWGSYAFMRRSYTELDFIFEYQITKKIKLGIVDYFALTDSVGAKNRFFNMRRKTTSHLIDIYAIVKPSAHSPLSLMYSVWLWGADRNTSTTEQNLSSYFEGRYEKAYKKVKASAFVGTTLWRGFYAPHAAFINIGVGLSKPIKLGNLVSIPAKIEFILNPETQNAFINAIITIK